MKKNSENVEKSGVLLIKQSIFIDFTRDSGNKHAKILVRSIEHN